MVTLVAVLWMLSAGGRAEGESPVRLAPVQVRAGGYLNGHLWLSWRRHRLESLRSS